MCVLPFDFVFHHLRRRINCFIHLVLHFSKYSNSPRFCCYISNIQLSLKGCLLFVIVNNRSRVGRYDCWSTVKYALAFVPWCSWRFNCILTIKLFRYLQHSYKSQSQLYYFLKLLHQQQKRRNKFSQSKHTTNQSTCKQNIIERKKKETFL